MELQFMIPSHLYCLSNQIDQGINLDFCREEQIPLIRRMTGGKAVLHQSDLTYSIVGELGDPQFGEGVHETYRSLAEGFILFFEKLGLNPQLVDASSSRDLEPHLWQTQHQRAFDWGQSAISIPSP